MSRRRGRPAGADGEQTRATILAAVTATPGINRTRLCAEVGYQWSTLGHHLRVLEDRRQIASHRIGRSRAYFRREIPDEHFPALALLSEPREREVLQIISDVPGLHQDHLYRRTPLSRRILTRLVDNLEDAGLVMRRDSAILPGPRLERAQLAARRHGAEPQVDDGLAASLQRL